MGRSWRERKNEGSKESEWEGDEEGGRDRKKEEGSRKERMGVEEKVWEGEGREWEGNRSLQEG